MSPLRDRYQNRRYLELPKIERKRVKLSWANRWYDGPIDGVAEFEREKYWFELVDDATDPREGYLYRDYLLVELSHDQLNDVERRHELFRAKIGSHLDYDENGRISGPSHLQPEDSWQEFYAAASQWPDLDLSSSRVVGWFEDPIGPIGPEDDE